MSPLAPAVDFAAPFEELRLGQGFCTPRRTLDEADVERFAALTGDRHPQHLDAAWAASSPFGERIAHGLLVVSCAAGLVPFDPERVLALRRIGDVVFKRPVRLGERISVEGTIAGLLPARVDAGLVRWAWAIRGERAELACRARVEVLWSTDGDADAELPPPIDATWVA